MSGNIIEKIETDSNSPAFAAIGSREAEQFFGATDFNLPMTFVRTHNARVLWVNARVMEDDANFHAVNCDEERYRQRLLDLCAYVTIPDDPLQRSYVHESGETIIGYADRYGGAGIGSNGGSGRAALINGYYIKGVGRTHLIGADTDAAHASGGAYLEESVRETIFSEIIAAEFPNGAIPTIAIIDTGIHQVWEKMPYGDMETRVLIVRPMFLRPAHFERATAFRSIAPFAGATDAKRVSHVFEIATLQYGHATLVSRFTVFWKKWAEQLAHSFIHRLSHSAISTSNICLDGSFVDFGASSALPSWGCATTVAGSPAVGNELKQLLDALRASTYYFARHLEPTLGVDQVYVDLCNQVVECYFNTLSIEFLRVCGIADVKMASVLRPIILKVLQGAQSEQYDILDFTPSLERRIRISALWDETVPEELRELRQSLDDCYPDLDVESTRLACQFIGADRGSLYRQEMRYRLMLEVENSKDHIGKIIEREICKGRRSSRLRPSGLVLTGAATAHDFGIVIFYSSKLDSYFAGIEWQTKDFFSRCLGTPTKFRNGNLLAIVSFDGSGLWFGRTPILIPCSVQMKSRSE